MGKRAIVIITEEAAFLPFFPKNGERKEPIVVERSNRSAFSTYRDERAITNRNLEVEDRDSRREEPPVRANTKIRTAVTSITFILHKRENRLMPKKKGTSSARARKTKASISAIKADERERRIRERSVEKGFRRAMTVPRILLWEGDIHRCF